MLRPRRRRYGFKTDLSTQDLAPLGAAKTSESEEKEGGTQTREQWSPLARSPFGDQLVAEQRDCISRVKRRCCLRSATSLRSIGRRCLPPVSQSAQLSAAVMEASGA